MYELLNLKSEKEFFLNHIMYYSNESKNNLS